MIGYKYFEFDGNCRIGVTARVRESGKLSQNGSHPEGIGELVVKDGIDGSRAAVIKLTESEDWMEFYGELVIPDGVHPLFLIYSGQGEIELKEIRFD